MDFTYCCFSSHKVTDKFIDFGEGTSRNNVNNNVHHLDNPQENLNSEIVL